jgi:predicted secreted protein
MSRRLLAMLGLLLVLPGCSDSYTLPLHDASINGKTVTYATNLAFTLELDVHSSSGYQWDHTISDPTIVRLDSTIIRPRNGGPVVPGALMVATFYWRALKAGSTMITLIERQAWQPDVPPITSISFTVSVTP